MCRRQCLGAAVLGGALATLAATATGAVATARALPVLTSLASTASAGPATLWPSCPEPDLYYEAGRGNGLKTNICGPTKVSPGTAYSYTVVLSNRSPKTLRTVKLGVYTYDPMTRSSRPYSREGVNFRYDPLMPLSVFRPFRDFQPDQTVRISFRLSFTKHKDPKGSNFSIGVTAGNRLPSPGRTYDVWWK